MTKCEHKLTKEQEFEKQRRALTAWLLDTTCETCIDEEMAVVQAKYDRMVLLVDAQLRQQGREGVK